MFNNYSGSRLWLPVAAYALAVFVLGWLLDQLLPCLLAGALFLLGWHYRQLQRLLHWLWHDRRLTPPQSRGSWEGVFNGVYRLQQKKRRKVNQLRELISRFRQGAEALPDAAVVLDEHYAILWCNSLAQRLLGLSWPKDKGQRLDNLIRHPDFVRYLHRASFTEPLELASPISPTQRLELRLMPYGECQLLLIARDISRLRQLEQTRKHFAANVSHELKTPLTVLQGYLEMLQDSDALAVDVGPEVVARQRALQLMQQQTDRMQAMVEQLLILSRIEDAPEGSWQEVVDMDDMLTVLAQDAKLLADGHQLTFDVAAGVALYGNSAQLRSACMNLIANALRYTPAGGQVHITWQRENGGARFSVRDSGIGIAPQHIPHLTERFYRVDSARSRQTGGSGLGLAIVKHALQHHHCQLEISSRLDHGSCFSFVIPPHLLVAPAHH